jgi:hypothetical protein
MIKKLLLVFILVQQIATAQILPADRRTDWSLAGYQDTLPVYGQVVNIMGYGAVGDGIAVNDTAIRNAIAVLNGHSGTIYFPTGNFLFRQSIVMPDSVVLRGNGADSTTLSFNLNGVGNLIVMSGSEGPKIASLQADAAKDSMSIIVDNDSAIHAGDYLRISQSDSALLFSSWAYGSVGQVVRVRSINNNTLYLYSPLRKNYTTADSSKVSIISARVGSGLECLTVNRLDRSVGQTTNIELTYAAKCWLKGIAGDMCNFAHVALSACTNVEITGCYFHDAFAYGGSGQGYGIAIQYTSGECLIENNVFNHLRHSMLIQAGANGNVCGYNSSTNPYWVDSSSGIPLPTNSAGDMLMHGNYPFLNLFEGNAGQNIVIDNSHGSNGPYNTYFRNRASLYGIFMNSTPASDSQNIIGNEVTNNGFLMGLYSLSGNGQFAFGNNIKGTIQPAGTNNLTDTSYYKKTRPLFFITSDVWPGIGPPNALGQGTIPAQRRQQQGMFTDCSTYYPVIDTTTHTSGIKSTQDDLVIAIYPNPNKGLLHIHYNGNDIITIHISDISGKDIIQRQVHSDDEIDISTLSDGLFLLHLYQGSNWIKSEKLLVIK